MSDEFKEWAEQVRWMRLPRWYRAIRNQVVYDADLVGKFTVFMFFVVLFPVGLIILTIEICSNETGVSPDVKLKDWEHAYRLGGSGLLHR